MKFVDVPSILSNKSVLIRIKPDMSPEERKSGISRSDIRIWKSNPYVKNKLYGQYKNSMIVHSISPTPSPARISPDQYPIVPSGDSYSVCQHSSLPTSPTIVPPNLLHSSVHEQSPSHSSISNRNPPHQPTGLQVSD